MADIKTDEDMVPPSTAERDHCCLLELPQELLDMICDYAYQFPGQHAIIWRKRWDRRELERKATDTKYALRPFPTLKINAFLVSKKFFIAAAKSYTSRGRFDLESLTMSHTSQLSGGIFYQWVTSLTMESPKLYVFKSKSFASLREVQLSLWPDCFYDMDPGAIYLRDCHESELSKTSAYLAIITNLTGLQRLKLHPRFDRRTRGHQKQFTANIKRFEDLVKPPVLPPAPLTPDAMAFSTTTPLYLGSAVQMDTAVLVHPESPSSALQRRLMRGSAVYAHAGTHIKAPRKSQNWQQGEGATETSLFGPNMNGSKYPINTQQPRLLRAAKSLGEIDIPDSLEDVMTMVEEDRDRVSRYLLRSKARKERDTKNFAEMLSTPRIEWDGVKLMDPIPLRLKPIGMAPENINATASVQRKSNTAKIAVSQHRDQGPDSADRAVVKADAKPSHHRKAEAVNATNSNEPQSHIADYHGHIHLPRSLTVADLLAEEQEGWSELHDMRHAFDFNEDDDDDDDDDDVPSDTFATNRPRDHVFELPTNPPTPSSVLPRPGPTSTRSQHLTDSFPALEQFDAKLNSWELSANSPSQQYADKLRAQANERGHTGKSLPSSATMPDLRVGLEEKRKWKKPLFLAIKKMVQKRLKNE